MSARNEKFRTREFPFARKMKPYGEKPGSYARHEERWQHVPGRTYKTTLSEWHRIKRQPKKAARQAAKTEIREQT